MKTKRVFWTFIAACFAASGVLVHFTGVPPSMAAYLQVRWVSWGLVGLFALAGAAVLLFDKTEGLLYAPLVRVGQAIFCFFMAGAIYLIFLS